MAINQEQQQLLRLLPGVDSILLRTHADPFFSDIPKIVIIKAIHQIIEKRRTKIMKADSIIQEKNLGIEFFIEDIKSAIGFMMEFKLKRVINATGVVVHTNLGRSLLSSPAIDNIKTVAAGYSNLEFDLGLGKRGSRYSVVEEILCEISGAESAMVVNNNAGAVLLSLDTLASGKKVIISRGELVEIGGSFRIPDVMEKSGAILQEVGTTNRTHIKDYENALDETVSLLLKVHTSNYSITGFTASVSLQQLVIIGAEHNIPVMEDLGSGMFVDFAKYGLSPEPTVQQSVATGADIITFSGDKLLGGPQAGIILGKRVFIEKIKQNPLTRALRIDKLTLAALESTLHLYRDEKKAVAQIPTLMMLTMPIEIIEQRALKLAGLLRQIKDTRLSFEFLDLPSKAGGGSLPLLNLPSKCIGVRITGLSPNMIEKKLRHYSPPIIGRIENNLFLMDLRTILDDQLEIIRTALAGLLQEIDNKL